MNRIIVLVLFLSVNLTVNSESIYVKYRDLLNLEHQHFSEINIIESSLVKRILYDYQHKYLIVKLNSNYYHYCGLSIKILNAWTSSQSLGNFYKEFIKGNYDCRTGFVPSYK